MKSAAVKRMRSALLETPRPACFVASQAAASRNPNTVFNIGGIGPLALQAGVTALHESGGEQQDLSLGSPEPSGVDQLLLCDV